VLPEHVAKRDAPVRTHDLRSYDRQPQQQSEQPPEQPTEQPPEQQADHPQDPPESTDA
jgi:hypothetical protein